MQITYYGYNGFVIQSSRHKVLVDPGASLYLFGLGPVIPREEWPDATHIVITHGDPDHYWHVDRVAQASGAPIICGSELVDIRDGEQYMVSPRAKNFQYGLKAERVYPMNPGERIEVNGLGVQAIPAVHGDLTISLFGGLIRKTFKKTPGEAFAVGCTGFVLEVDGVRLANLGDTMLLPEWGRLEPDVLMIPIGGTHAGNTMNEREALQAVEMIAPRLVIPCHYDCGVLFRRRGNPADAGWFKAEVERLGVRCAVLESGQSLDYAHEALSA